MSMPLTLRQLRLSKGLTQDVIGNRKDIGEIEKGVKMPGPRLVRRMAQSLGVSTDTVFAACAESRRVREADDAQETMQTGTM
jgi:transcriptional regulator with XRE-family HTH domain